MRVRLLLPHDFRQDLGKVLVVFFSSFLFFVLLLFVFPTGPLFFSSLYVFLFSFHFSTLLSLKNLMRVTWKEWFGWKFCKRGAATRVMLSVLRERKSHLFFLSLHLYSFLNEVGCVGMLNTLILVSFILFFDQFPHVSS